MTTTTAKQLPDPETAALARASASELSRLLAARPDIDRAQIKLDGHDLILPRAALTLLRELLADMAQGHAVTIVPTHAELTTQEAANLLNVSRPHLVKLLEDEKIPFRRIGTHRRIRFEDLTAYQSEQADRSREALAALAEEAQEHNMGGPPRNC